MAAAEELEQTEKPSFLYRHFDCDGNLLYVGISLNAISRLSQHGEHSGWFAQIKSVSIESHPSRASAVEAEKEAIRSERPKFNVIHNRRPDPPSLAEQSQRDLMRKVFYKPAYTLKEVADELSLPKKSVQRLVDEGQLGCVYLGARRYVTGWQLISFLEWWDSVDMKPSDLFKKR